MGNGKKILLVDDEQDFVTILKLRLEGKGYSVIIAKDGKEALEKVKKEKPDLILLDLLLPEISGYEVCRILKNDEPFKNIPIIIISGLGQKKEIEKTKEYGANSFFIKPFEVPTLISKMEELMDNKK